MSDFSPVRRAAVVERAGSRCEYCHLPTRGQVATFPIDHILPKSLGGGTELDNLALACPHCNVYKGVQVGVVTRLFNPRIDVWSDHLEWRNSGELAARTPIGEATIASLRINDADMIELRKLLQELGLFAELVTVNELS